MQMGQKAMSENVARDLTVLFYSITSKQLYDLVRK